MTARWGILLAVTFLLGAVAADAQQPQTEVRELRAAQVDYEGCEAVTWVPMQAEVVWVDPAGMRVDGALDDWPAAAAGFDVGALDDPADLSARAMLVLSRHSLYLACVVRDDVHVNREFFDTIWNGDSVQFALDPLCDRRKGAYAGDDHEIGVALTQVGVMAWGWQRSGVFTRAPMTYAEAAVLRDDEAGTTTYELRVPIAELWPLQPAAMPYCGFDIIVNDADHRHRDGSVDWTGALTSGKDPAAFGVLRFPRAELAEAQPLAGWVELPDGPRPVEDGAPWYVTFRSVAAETLELELGGWVESGPMEDTPVAWRTELALPPGLSRWELRPDLAGIAPARITILPRLPAGYPTLHPTTNPFTVYVY